MVTPTAEPSSPCGICRQLLAEFGPDVAIFAASSVGDAVMAARLGDLLPLAFWAEEPGRAREPVSGDREFEFVLGREISPAEQPACLDALERAVRARTDLRPRVGLVLGSGLGGLADALDLEVAIPFGELPGWPPATAPGHAGRLLFGRLSGVPAVVQQGRFHLYEGHSAGFVVQPVLLMGRLGCGDRRAHQRGRRRQPRLRRRDADGHRRPPEPDRPAPADRPECAGARAALSGHDRGLGCGAASAAA